MNECMQQEAAARIDIFETAIGLALSRSIAFVLSGTPSWLCSEDNNPKLCWFRPPSRANVIESFHRSNLHL
jgi:hypothetical protein